MMPILQRMLGGYRDYLSAAPNPLMIGRGMRDPHIVRRLRRSVRL
jgi:hypothetical protein